MSHLRDDHVVHAGGVAGQAEHAGDREAVDVGVDNADRQALFGECDSEVGGYRRLADTALAGGHRVDAGERVRFVEGNGARGAGPLELFAHLLALLGCHGAQFHVDGGDAFNSLYGLRGVADDGVLERTARDCQQNAHVDGAVVCDGEFVEHSQFDDAAADFGVYDAFEGFIYRVPVGRCH